MADIAVSRVQDYLDDLDRALGALTRSRRREIVQDIRAHIEAALADAPAPSTADVETILDHLGTPDEIAAAAMAEQPIAAQRAQRRFGALEVFALILVPIGGIVLPIVGWFVGVILLWLSSVWSTRDKLIATLLVPGGLLPALVLTVGSTGSVSSERCLTPGGSAVSAAAHQAMHCTSSSSSPSLILVFGLLLVTVGGPLFSFVWLLRRATRSS